MPNLIRCGKGHFYDSEKFPSCPYCAPSANNMEIDLSHTMPVNQGGGAAQSSDIGKTMPMGYKSSNPAQGIDKTMPIGGSIPNNPAAEEDIKTVAVIRKRVHNEDDVGINPVAGWLVCVDGKEKGRDYRIFAGNNFLGRSETMDICIRGDDTISREKHACVSYDDKKNRFYIYQGDSRGLVYVNDETVFVPQLLNPYDIIEVGKTKLTFIPFCSEKFTWE